MKKVFILIILLSSVSIFFNKATAGIRVPIGTVEKLHVTKDLPDTDDYKNKEGNYIDLGVRYSVYTIAFVPIYTTSDPVACYIGTEGGEEVYYDIDEEQLKAMGEDEIGGMPFWDKWGGKLIVLALIGLGIWGYLPSKDDDESEEEEE